MGLKSGDSFIVNMVNNEIHITSMQNEIKKAQNLLRQYTNTSKSLVDEFLEQKYQEAEKENSKF